MKNIKTKKDLENKLTDDHANVTKAMENLIKVVEQCGASSIIQPCGDYLVQIKLNTKPNTKFH